MIARPVSCVVDANTAVKLVVVESDSAQAQALFAHLFHDPAARFSVPDLFYPECLSILRKKTFAGEMTVAEARAHAIYLKGLQLDVLDSGRLMLSALDIVMTYHTSAYDATYVAAAAQLGVPLITADARLVKKMGASPYTVLLLETLTIPPPPP